MIDDASKVWISNLALFLFLPLKDCSTIIKIGSPIVYSAAVETDSSSDSVSAEPLNAGKSSMLAENSTRTITTLLTVVKHPNFFKKTIRKNLDIPKADYK
jgi:hypothetical protein